MQGTPRWRLALAGALALAAASAIAAAAQMPPRTMVVSSNGPLRTISAALAQARDGDSIRVAPGVYRESTIVVDKRVDIAGDGDAILDGEHRRQIMTVTVNDVSIRHLHFRNVGVSDLGDLAAVKVVNADRCTIADNTIENAVFGIYLARSAGCRIVRNAIRGQARDEVRSGNGIHLWQSRDALIANNHITGHRDGIYFEFVTGTAVLDNVSEDNLRYGLHFMYSDDCRYVANVFRHNVAGVAVMYTHRVVMIGNTFEQNWGSASYGLLFKEIDDSRVESNHFVNNTVGLMADDANRIVAVHNEFRDNGWALKLMANTDDGRFEANNFMGNTFDVSTNGAQTSTIFTANYWDHYRGYDLDRDGFGDVPYHPVRLFSLIVGRNPPAMVLMRSVFVAALDAAERAIPALTPETPVDERPAMRPIP